MSEDDEMAFPLRDDEVFSDSEYESAHSHPPTPLEIPELVSQIMIAPSASAGKVKKKLRRGTGLPLPFFRFPRGRVDEDVEKIEDDVNQLLHLGETIKIEVEGLRRDTHTEQDSYHPQESTPSNDAITSNHHRSLADDLTHDSSRSLIPTQPESKQDTPTASSLTSPDAQNLQEIQITNLQSLQESLTQIRTRLTTLESAISANISAQSLALTGSSQPPVADYFSLPSFKVENKNLQSVGAVLGTVKVCCAVERGLEALVGAMEFGVQGKEEGMGKGEEIGRAGLMEACLAKPDEVAIEMRKAIVGMRRVLKAKGEKSRAS